MSQYVLGDATPRDPAPASEKVRVAPRDTSEPLLKTAINALPGMQWANGSGGTAGAAKAALLLGAYVYGAWYLGKKVFKKRA